MKPRRVSSFWLLLFASPYVVAFAGCAGVVYLAVWEESAADKVARLKRDLARQLPNGSTLEQSRGWFASHGIEPQAIAAPSGKIVFLHGDATTGIAIDYHIQVELEFDAEGRLESARVVKYETM